MSNFIEGFKFIGKNKKKKVPKLSIITIAVICRSLKDAWGAFNLNLPASLCANVLDHYSGNFFKDEDNLEIVCSFTYIDFDFSTSDIFYKLFQRCSRLRAPRYDDFVDLVKYNVCWYFGTVTWHGRSLECCPKCFNKIYWYIWSNYNLEFVSFSLKKCNEKMTRSRFISSVGNVQNWCNICCVIICFKLESVEINQIREDVLRELEHFPSF